MGVINGITEFGKIDMSDRRHSKVRQMCVATAFLMSTWLTAGQAQEAPAFEGGAKVGFDAAIYDFGEVKNGEIIKHRFKIQNEGDQNLKILEVKPSCGCTTAGDWPKVLGPGESGFIPIQLKTDRFRGNLTKTVRVRTNDPKKPTSVLQIKGTVWTPIQIDPEYAAFSRLKSIDAEASKVIKISNHTGQPLKILEVESSNPKFGYELREIKEGNLFELEIKTAPPLVYGLNRSYFKLKTNSQDSPTLSITAHANVAKPVEATPSYLTLPVGTLDKDLKKYITIINNSGGDLVVSEPQIDLEGIEISKQELRTGKYFRYTMVFPKGFEVKENVSGSFRVKTSHEQFKTLEIPLKGYKRPVALPTR